MHQTIPSLLERRFTTGREPRLLSSEEMAESRVRLAMGIEGLILVN